MDASVPKLGRFIRVRQRADGTDRVFMSVPRHLRPAGWPPNIILPEIGSRRGSLRDPQFRAAVREDARRLNARLDKRREDDANRAQVGRRSIVELADIYFKTMRYRRLPESRRYRNRQCIMKIIEWSSGRGHPEFATLMKPDIEDFLSAYDDRPARQLDLRSAWNILCNEAVGAGWRPDHPATGIPWTPPVPKEVNLWREEDAKAYADMARQMKQPGMAALIEVQMRVGQRLGDVRTAKHGVNYVGGRLLLRQSKGGARVGPPLPAHLRDLIESVRMEDSPYLFNDFDTGTSFTHARLHQRFVEVRHAVAKKGQPKLHLRALRHSAVCQMVLAGVPLPQIRAVTGHKQQTINTIIERYAIDLDRFADAAMRTLHKASGGTDADFLEVDEEVFRDWIGNADRRETYEPPEVDEARPGRHLAAQLGQHRKRLTVPRWLVEWPDEV